jgi:hypothetical protein
MRTVVGLRLYRILHSLLVAVCCAFPLAAPHAAAAPTPSGLASAKLTAPITDQLAPRYAAMGPFVETAKLVGSGLTGYPRIGQAVAISADGSTLLLGGSGDSQNIGAVWVYTRTASGWTQQGAKLTPSSGGGSFGAAVALSANGSTALIGAPNDAAGGGSAWVFKRAGGVWYEQQSIPYPYMYGAAFGTSVALSADGKTALIGAPYDLPTRNGQAYLFRSDGSFREMDGFTMATTRVGWSVSLSADGRTALVGGPSDSSASSEPGSFCTYTTADGTHWIQGLRATPSDNVGQSRFGWSVSLSADGGTALIGGPYDDSSRGAVWLYTRSGSTWSERAKLKPTDEKFTAGCGAAVALSSDAKTALVGGPWDWGDGSGQRGAAWIFSDASGSLTQRGSKLMAANESDRAEFGSAAAISGDGRTALIGGLYDQGTSPDGIGAGWVFADLPTVTSVSPSSGTVKGGTYVTISGGELSGASEVLFGSTPASFTPFSATQIIAVAPAGSLGPVDVQVTTSAGQSAITSADRFTYLAANPSPTPTGAHPYLSSASLTGVAVRRARLRFTISAGEGAAPVASLSVTLPKGITLSRRAAGVRAGVTAVLPTGKPVTVTAVPGRRQLRLILQTAAARVRVTIKSPALVISRALAAKTRERRAGRLTFTVVPRDTEGSDTRLSLKLKPR